jgi:hypothetical protein
MNISHLEAQYVVHMQPLKNVATSEHFQNEKPWLNIRKFDPDLNAINMHKN